MKLTKKYKEIIINEIDFVVNNMDQTSNISEKLFFFSGLYGMFLRILNLEFDEDLVCIYLTLRTTYDNFIQRLELTKTGTINPLSEEHFKKLSVITKKLKDDIKDDREISNTIKNFCVLAYSTTGNGYYLMKKEMLNLSCTSKSIKCSA